MYLDPKDGKEPMFKAAVRLLHNHGESLDPLQVLEVSSLSLSLSLGIHAHSYHPLTHTHTNLNTELFVQLLL